MALYKSEQDRATIFNLYDEKLNQLNVHHQHQTLLTSYGKTNIITCGNKSKPPIIVIHGANGCAPIAIETYIDLLDHFSVYAVDVIGQPNKSDSNVLSMTDDSYGIWMNEIIEQLTLKNVTLAGFSLGGLIILKTLEYDEKRIKEVYLSSPAYMVNTPALKALFGIFIPMKRYIKTKNQKYLNRFLKHIFTEKDEFALQFLSKVFLGFKMDFSPVPIIKTTKANSIKTPITLFAASEDIIFPGIKMMTRATKIFPSLKRSFLLENSKHVQGKNQNKLINQQIIKDQLLNKNQHENK